MNAQLKETNHKFTLVAGTTNRHKWHKKTVAALQVLDNLKLEQLEKTGIKGGEEREHIFMVMCGDVANAVAYDLYNEIGDAFDWVITKDNASDILSATLKAIPKAREAMPVTDSRKTLEQVAEVQAGWKKVNEERESADAIKAEKIEAIKTDLMALYPWAMADDGKISGYARAAKNMKQELKRAFPYVKFSVRSESFSMGNAIRIEWNNGASTKAVEAITNKYQYYVDKCTDDTSNEARAVAIVLGQSKYVTTSRNISNDLREQVGRDICKEYGEEYDQNAQIGGRWLSDCIYIALGVDITGDYDGVKLVNNEMLAQFKTPEIKPAAAVTGGAAHIEEHEHTKRGFMMFMVVLDEKLERDDFNAYRNHAKNCGGWYSRAWGATPGGFAFKESEAAAGFLAWVIGNSEPTPTGGGTPSPRKQTNHTDKLRGLADKMADTITDKFATRQENTPKRVAQAAHTRHEGERLKRTQAALYGLADLHEAGNVPDILAGITSKKAVYDLMGEKSAPVSNGFHGYSVGNGEASNDTPQAAALWQLLTPKSDDEKAADDLAQKITGLQFSNIAGYFPTPAPVVNQMIEAACIQDGHAVLEPSAGSGALCDGLSAVLSDDGRIDCFEVNHTLREILTAKGYNVAGHNFMEALINIHGEYDRVLMNPPFEKLQDIEHIRRAFSFLKDGGRLVSIMSPSAFFREDKKSRAFRQWFDDLGGERIELPAGSFKESGTGVNTIIIIIDK